MEYGYYHPEAGYWQTITQPTQDTLDSYPEGTVNVPLKPGKGYEYNGTEWVAPSEEWLYEEEAAIVRAIRNKKLKHKVDPAVSNPLRWASMSTEEQDAVATYRQELLDITDQEGFPYDITWPTKPSFL